VVEGRGPAWLNFVFLKQLDHFFDRPRGDPSTSAVPIRWPAGKLVGMTRNLGNELFWIVAGALTGAAFGLRRGLGHFTETCLQYELVIPSCIWVFITSYAVGGGLVVLFVMSVTACFRRSVNCQLAGDPQPPQLN
jgi:hypothetical protein